VNTAAVRLHRDLQIRRAFVLEWITIAWMIVEAVVALVSGVRAHSVSLVAFGADSAIELASASVLIWRLRVELRAGEAFDERVEERASKVGAALLALLATYVVVSAGWGLWHREGEAFTVIGVAVTALALPIMIVLARGKTAIAKTLGSAALRADAAEAVTCGYLSLIVLVGLLVQAAFGWWWIDGVASLGVLIFLLREAREAWTGDCGCSD
jgi:divalent metal cation (Fe/Co/Zn/Cd) transporter